MTRDMRRLLLGLGIIVVALAGLVAISGLVPAVGCAEPKQDFQETLTSVNMTAPNEANAGDRVSITGTLYKVLPGPRDSTGHFEYRREPFPQQRIEINSLQASDVVYTDENGNFAGELALKIPGSYVIKAVYRGDALLYYRESGAQQEITVIGELPLAKPLPWWPFALAGGVVAALIIVFYLRSRQARVRAPSIEAGRSHERRSLRPWLAAALVVLVVAGIGFAVWPRDKTVIRPSGPTTRLRTVTEIKAPARAAVGEDFTISGRLTVGGGDEPLPGRTIEVFVSGTLATTNRAAVVTTDNAGRFSGNLSIRQSGRFEVNAVFRDTGGEYLQSSDSRIVTVGKPQPEFFGDWNSPGWLSVVSGVAVLAALGVAFLVRYRRQHKPRSHTEAETAPPPPQSFVTAPSAAETHATGSAVTINFPDIARPLPDVWGQDESLLVVFAVDGTRYPLGEYSLEIEFGPDASVRAPFGREDHVFQEHAFRQPGEYRISAVLTKEVRNGYLPGSRVVRIVNYREEIVRLYNEMVATIKTRGVPVSHEMTAGEVAIRLARDLPELRGDTTRELVSVFEEANYSLHRIRRPAYEKMYLACLEVERHAGE